MPRKRQTILRARSSRKSAAGHRIPAALSLVLMAALPIAAVVLLLFGVRALVHLSLAGNTQFALGSYDIQSDGRLTPALIREYAALPDSGNVFALDLPGIRERLERIPRVRRATIERRLPDTLVIRVAERVPLAQVDIPGQSLRMAVDRDGHVLGPASTAPHAPVIDGLRQSGLTPGGVVAEDAVLVALRLLDICEQTALGQEITIRRISVRDPDGMQVWLAGGERVQMPHHDLERKLRELVSILRMIEDLRMAPDRDQVVIDLTTEERFPVRGLAARPAG